MCNLLVFIIQLKNVRSISLPVFCPQNIVYLPCHLYYIDKAIIDKALFVSSWSWILYTVFFFVNPLNTKINVTYFYHVKLTVPRYLLKIDEILLINVHCDSLSVIIVVLNWLFLLSEISARKCELDADNFCYICGKLFGQKRKRPIKEAVKLTCFQYLQIPVSDIIKRQIWVPRVVSESCRSKFTNCAAGNKKIIPIWNWNAIERTYKSKKTFRFSFFSHFF